jgi:metal-responsive CopG/Arc/MetJ family transcriptional regulator
MANPKYQTRLPNDDAERLDNFVDEHDISESEAVRRLVRTGLDVEDPDNDRYIDTDGMATASINQTAGQTGSILMLLMLGFLTAVEVGLL